jgi:hypothetical protein
LAVAHGIGGSIELYGHGIRIRRQGFVNFLLTWLAGRPAFVDSLIPLERISSFDIIKPVFFNNFVAISYGGGPPLTGKDLHDSTAENALLMNFFDNRAFYVLRDRYDEIAALRAVSPQALRSMPPEEA